MPDSARILYDSINETLIHRFIEDKWQEDLHLDFKLAQPDLSRDDRINLAIALSGFANADGGVIVWGVKTQRMSGVDVAAEPSPITPLSQFLAKLTEFTGQAVNPLVDGIDHKRVESAPDSGFAVTLVPASDSGPHMAKFGEDRYYKRTGSRFAKMEHYEVADMFGRRQRPKLELSYRLGQQVVSTTGGMVLSTAPQVTLILSNSGRGSAKAPFLEVTISPPNIYRIELAAGVRAGPSGALMKPMRVLHSTHRFIGYADFLIHPSVEFDIATLVGTTTITDDLTLNCQITAENYQLESTSINIKLSDLMNAT